MFRTLVPYCGIFVLVLVVAGCKLPNGTDVSSDTASPSANSKERGDQGFGSSHSIQVPFGQALAIQTPMIAFQADSKFLVVGGTNVGGGGNNGSQLEIARYHSNGTIDATFGSNGFATVAYGTNSSLIGVAVQPDQKIVASGYSYQHEAILVRFNTNGSIDSSFSMVNLPSNGFLSPTIQADGKILVSGLSDGIFRFNSDGSVDSSFGNSGKVVDASVGSWVHWDNIYNAAFALQADQKIVACGNTPFYQGANWSDSFGTLIRLNPDGSKDTTFGSSGNTGALIFGGYPCRAIAIQPDGKIVIGGSFWYANTGVPITSTPGAFYVARYNSDGSPDMGFGVNGAYISSFPHTGNTWGNLTSLVLLPNGKIFAIGMSGSIVLNSDGSPDPHYVDDIPVSGISFSTLSPSGSLFLLLGQTIYRTELVQD